MRDLEQLLHAFLDGALQADHLEGRVLGQLPFPGQGAGHLADFQVVEGLFQDQQLVVVLQARFDGLEGIVGIGRAERDLQVGVHLPQLFDGVQAVPARGHAHVDKHHGVGRVGVQGLLDQRQGFLALVGRIQVKRLARRRGGAEEGGLQGVEGGLAVLVGTEDLAKILVDRSRVIHDQDAPVGPARFRPHGVLSTCKRLDGMTIPSLVLQLNGARACSAA